MVIIGVRPPYFHKLLRINSSFEIGRKLNFEKNTLRTLSACRGSFVISTKNTYPPTCYDEQTSKRNYSKSINVSYGSGALNVLHC